MNAKFTLSEVFIMKTEILKKSLLSLLAVGLLVVNIMLPSKTVTQEERPQAIIAVVASGGSLATFLPTLGQGILAGITIDVEELAPAFALAASGATMGEVVGMLFSILGIGLGVGVVLGLAA